MKNVHENLISKRLGDVLEVNKMSEKNYIVKYDGLHFEISMPETATKKEIETEVNRIIRDPKELLEYVKRSQKEQYEFYEKELKFYKSMYESASERANKYFEMLTELWDSYDIRVIPNSEEEQNSLNFL